MALRVLLVEDNPDHALLTKRGLERDRRIAKVDVCSDASSALGLLSGGVYRPDVIVADLRLPGLSGLELLSRVKAMPEASEIPVVLLSAYARECEVRYGMDRGALAFISKPLRAQALIECLSEIASSERTPRDTVGGTPSELPPETRG